MRSAFHETEQKNALDIKEIKKSVLAGTQSEPAEIVPAGEIQFDD
jgi:hypothetical protein